MPNKESLDRTRAFRLPDNDDRALEKLAERTGISCSKLLRIAVLAFRQMPEVKACLAASGQKQEDDFQRRMMLGIFKTQLRMIDEQERADLKPVIHPSPGCTCASCKF